MKNKQNGFGVIGILAMLVVVVVIVLAGILVWQRTKDKDAKQKTTTSSNTSSSNSTPAATEPISKESDVYKIEAVRLELQLNDQITDLVAKIDGNKVWFTVSGFLDRANTAGYSRIISGENSCERLAGITLFKDAAEVRSYGTEVTGDLIDANGDPIQNRIIKLSDNRYALPAASQSPCSSDSSFDVSSLQEEESKAKAAIRAAISDSLRSF